MFKITYCIKEKDNCLLDKYLIFSTFQEAINAIKNIQTSNSLVGKPIVERI